jgi:hypothetical protein
MPAGEFKAALRIVWRALSLAALSAVLAPWMFSAEQIAAVVPKCEWKARYGKECFLCGMTTAFIAIAHGRVGEAERVNRGSVPLYAGLVVNQIVVVLFRKPKPCSAG